MEPIEFFDDSNHRLQIFPIKVLTIGLRPLT